MTTPIELLVILPMKSPFVLTTVEPNEVYGVPFNILFTAVLCVRPRDIEYVDSIHVLYVFCTCYRCVYMLGICILGSFGHIIHHTYALSAGYTLSLFLSLSLSLSLSQM